MECKYLGARVGDEGENELIDTLWNVNILSVISDSESVLRINRYIMECKFCSETARLATLAELIDTLWNVNSNKFPPFKKKKSELIDTLWNVNVFEEHNEESFNEN